MTRCLGVDEAADLLRLRVPNAFSGNTLASPTRTVALSGVEPHVRHPRVDGATATNGKSQTEHRRIVNMTVSMTWNSRSCAYYRDACRGLGAGSDACTPSENALARNGSDYGILAWSVSTLQATVHARVGLGCTRSVRKCLVVAV